MPLVRRFIAALCSLLFLQLLLLGSGSLCAMQQGSAHAMPGMAATDGVAHQSVVSAAMDDDSPVSPNCDGGNSFSGCHLPFAPAQCAMTACVAVATSPATAIASAKTAAEAIEVISRQILHSSPSIPPELPPPRA